MLIGIGRPGSPGIITRSRRAASSGGNPGGGGGPPRILIGGYGKIYDSADGGQTWATHTNPNNQYAAVWEIVPGGGVVNIVQDSGNQDVTTLDFATWTPNGQYYYFYSGLYDGTWHYIGGGYGSLLRTQNFQSWSFLAQFGSGRTIGAMAYAPGVGYVLTEDTSRSVYYHSLDGTTWTESSTHVGGGSSNWHGIAYSPLLGRWVAVGTLNSYTNLCHIGTTTTPFSGNAADWTVQEEYDADSGALYDVCWGNGLFVAVGYGGRIRTSPDGLNWTPRTSGTTGTLRAVKYDAASGTFYAAGWSNALIKSPDGIEWEVMTPPATTDFWSLTLIPAA